MLLACRIVLAKALDRTLKICSPCIKENRWLMSLLQQACHREWILYGEKELLHGYEYLGVREDFSEWPKHNVGPRSRSCLAIPCYGFVGIHIADVELR
jgi:hypothetical protein